MSAIRILICAAALLAVVKGCSRDIRQIEALDEDPVNKEIEAIRPESSLFCVYSWPDTLTQKDAPIALQLKTRFNHVFSSKSSGWWLIARRKEGHSVYFEVSRTALLTRREYLRTQSFTDAVPRAEDCMDASTAVMKGWKFGPNNFLYLTSKERVNGVSAF